MMEIEGIHAMGKEQKTGFRKWFSRLRSNEKRVKKPSMFALLCGTHKKGKKNRPEIHVVRNFDQGDTVHLDEHQEFELVEQYSERSFEKESKSFPEYPTTEPSGYSVEEQIMVEGLHYTEIAREPLVENVKQEKFAVQKWSAISDHEEIAVVESSTTSDHEEIAVEKWSAICYHEEINAGKSSAISDQEISDAIRPPTEFAWAEVHVPIDTVDVLQSEEAVSLALGSIDEEFPLPSLQSVGMEPGDYPSLALMTQVSVVKAIDIVSMESAKSIDILSSCESDQSEPSESHTAQCVTADGCEQSSMANVYSETASTMSSLSTMTSSTSSQSESETESDSVSVSEEEETALQSETIPMSYTAMSKTVQLESETEMVPDETFYVIDTVLLSEAGEKIVSLQEEISMEVVVENPDLGNSQSVEADGKDM